MRPRVFTVLNLGPSLSKTFYVIGYKILCQSVIKFCHICYIARLDSESVNALKLISFK